MLCPDGTTAVSGRSWYLFLLDQLPSSFWAKSSTAICRTHRAPPFRIQIDPSKAVPRINQYAIDQVVFQGINPIIEDYKAQGLVLPCANPCNIPILPVGRGGWGSQQPRLEVCPGSPSNE